MLTNLQSVLDIFKIAIGPSEVYTLGAWRAAQRFLQSLEEKNEIQFVTGIKILLYGPVAKSCHACRTDHAIMLGLSGYNPVSFDLSKAQGKIKGMREKGSLFLRGIFDVPFEEACDIVCLENETLPFHQNALTFLATVTDGQIAETYNLTDETVIKTAAEILPFPINDANELIRYCEKKGKTVSELVFENEKAVMPIPMIRITAKNIWTVMQESIYNGCGKPSADYSSWVEAIRQGGNTFSYTLDWIGCFALAVEKENSSMGRVVAAPTSRFAGIVASVLQYYRVFCSDRDTDSIRFLLTAGQIGNLFKENFNDYVLATAMAAAGLAELLGGSVRQVIAAAELATAENYASGAIKAIMAAQSAVKTL